MTKQEILRHIDHTQLKSFCTWEDIKKLCDEAIKYDFKSVCVNPANVQQAANLLKGSDVLVCTVIGFPLGANTIETKALETIDAIKNGADEIGLDDYLYGEGVCVIEWASMIEDILPKERLDIKVYREGENDRRIELTPVGEFYESIREVL